MKPSPGYRCLIDISLLISNRRRPQTMASAAQIEANRKNAQKSTGPVTQEGKGKSRRNSIRHGLLSRVIPIDAPGYRELLDGLYTSLTPQNELERMLVDQIAITTMRLRRIWG